MSLRSDATLVDLIGTLKDPESYLCGVLQNMSAWKKANGSAYVNVGTTGRGVVPHYRVGPSFDGLEFGKNLDMSNPDDLGEFLREYSKHCNAFHGSSHKRLEWGVMELRNGSWSSCQMSYADVQGLLGNLRSSKRKA